MTLVLSALGLGPALGCGPSGASEGTTIVVGTTSSGAVMTSDSTNTDASLDDDTGFGGFMHDPDFGEGTGLDCDPGLVCQSSASPQSCTGAAACCAALCDVEGSPCAGLAAGRRCLPWYGEGDAAPPGLEHLGHCAQP